MKKLMDRVAHCIESAGGAAILVMTAVVLLQVVMRYVFNTPLTWTEEFARYIFVYITFLGAGLLVYERGHLFVEVIFSHLPEKVKMTIQLCIDGIVLGFSIYLAVSSSAAMQFAKGSRSTAMQIPMEYIGLSVMLGAILMILFSLYNIVKDVQNIGGKGGKG